MPGPFGRVGSSRRVKPVPFRAALPNLVTLLALCAGLTAIRMAIENRFEMAVTAIIFAALLDAVDGRVARLLKTTSLFGEQLDSLADFVDFGVAPAILLYVWRLEDLGSLGWIAALALAMCAALRLARFNAALSSEEPPAWQKDFFVGVPAPAAAVAVLLPLCLDQTGISVPHAAAGLVALYTVVIACLMVSRLPTFSGKRIGTRIPRENLPWVLVVGVVVVALLASYTFAMLAVGAIAYLLHLPFAWRAWHRKAAAAEIETQEAEA
ncbi:CDP-diacylglycerol--serine O-phosphatidyltransferase [Faunimonas pinastri]|uniref:CDP-diacylglycerol--serine O-phosphatidyltransferase n=1 Tax=Faunimonas pinastri TaxID=1855383 RepID=A0A1H9JA75_9HYPH|nr:CDP-diacylglycerol--serine O-phosphatidyltransferase [Faunimonas pinastri]SEQ83716.1 CDP-diacylglycerol--serine O-phosphatidyltransferase [Faunimonas pinastri]